MRRHPDPAGVLLGRNLAGGLGDGTLSDRLSPTPVAGGLTFRGIAAGYRDTCGRVVTSNVAYCWGLNNRGQLETAPRWIV